MSASDHQCGRLSGLGQSQCGDQAHQTGGRRKQKYEQEGAALIRYDAANRRRYGLRDPKRQGSSSKAGAIVSGCGVFYNIQRDEDWQARKQQS